jgi:hypothetical protein
MSFSTTYALRRQLGAAVDWLATNRRVAALGGALAIATLVYVCFFTSPFDTREIVILYRPDRGTVVFNLDDEYRLRSVRVAALDDNGVEGETIWTLDVPGNAPRLSTFSFPGPGRGDPADNPAPALAPGQAYRLEVFAAGAHGTADFRLDPGAQRRPG